MKKQKIEILVKDKILPYGEIAGEFEINESNIECIAKTLNIDYLGGDNGYSEVYVFNVDENRVNEVIKELLKIDFISFADIYNEEVRKVFDIKEHIIDSLEKIENISEKTLFEKDKYNTEIVNIEEYVKELKKIY